MAQPLVLVQEGGEDKVCIVDYAYGVGMLGGFWRVDDSEVGLLWCCVESFFCRGGDGGGKYCTEPLVLSYTIPIRSYGGVCGDSVGDILCCRVGADAE